MIKIKEILEKMIVSRKTTPYGTIEYNYDSENCLISSGSRGQVFINYKYDRMGNLLTEESPNKITKYAYNSQNRLIYCEVTDKSAKQYAQTSYAYDAFGRRIIVQDKGEAALRTLYDGLTFDIIKQSQTNASGLFTDTNMTGIRWGKTGKPTGDRYRYISDDETSDNNRYIYIAENNYKTVSSRYRGERTQISANGSLATQTTSDYGTEYFSTDLLGSIRTTSDSFGTARTTVSYDAFGSLIEGSFTDTADFGYLGKQHDPTSSLYNYGYRDYKSQQARFTTIDPIRDGSNWFVYCNGDPVNFVDLWGFNPVAIGITFGGIVIVGGTYIAITQNESYQEAIKDAADAIGSTLDKLNKKISEVETKVIFKAKEKIDNVLSKGKKTRDGEGNPIPPGNQSQNPLGKGANAGAEDIGDPGDFGGSNFKTPKDPTPGGIALLAATAAALLDDNQPDVDIPESQADSNNVTDTTIKKGK